jgi:hypothetical protein
MTEKLRGTVQTEQALQGRIDTASLAEAGFTRGWKAKHKSSEEES